jgi:hypothetical protein
MPAPEINTIPFIISTVVISNVVHLNKHLLLVEHAGHA